MHIEPGYVSTAKIALANITAASILGSQSLHLLKKPQHLVGGEAVADLVFHQGPQCSDE